MNSQLVKYDPELVKQVLKLLHSGGHAFEIRIPKTKGQRMVNGGYFNDIDKAAACLASWFGKATVYVTLNPINEALLARQFNRIGPIEVTTSDIDVTRRRWLLIDCDAARPADISANDEEHGGAIARAYEIREYLKAEGWGEVIFADSGNGAHILVPIDLPNDDASKELLRNCLCSLNMLFGDDRIGVDEKNFNAARVCKLYGTVSMKGDNIPDRPHRLASIIETPTALVTPTPTALLQKLADKLPKAEPKPASSQRTSRGEKFDIENWIQSHGIEVSKTGTSQGGRKWELRECPWNPEHQRSAFIMQDASGMLRAGCLHNSCSGRMWSDLRLVYEPDAYDRPAVPSLPSPAQAPRPQPQQSKGPAAVVTHDADAWEEPVPFESTNLSKFPLGAFSEILRGYVETLSTTTMVPFEMTAPSVLAAVSYAVSRRFDMRIDDRGPQPLCMWSVITGPVASGKSLVDEFCNRKGREIEKEWIEATRHDRARLASDANRRLIQIKRLENELENPTLIKGQRRDPQHILEGQLNELLAKPIVVLAEPRLFIKNVTPESFATRLANDESNATALFTGEAYGLFDIITGKRYGKDSMANLSLFLQSFDGSSERVDRKDQALQIARPDFTMSASVPPDILIKLVADEEMIKSGFLSRCLFSIPEIDMSLQVGRRAPINESRAYAFDALMAMLYRIQHPCPGNPAARYTLTLDRETEDLQIEYDRAIRARMAYGRDLAEEHTLKPWAARLSAKVMRIAAVLHVVDHIDEPNIKDIPIGCQTAERAWAIGAYYIQHAKAAFGGLAVEADNSLATRILKWIEKNDWQPSKDYPEGPGLITVRLCMRGVRIKGAKKEVYDAALIPLLENGFVRLWAGNKTGPGIHGKYAEYFEVHPRCFTQPP